MDDKLEFEIDQWCNNMANCITTQKDWEVVFARVLHTLTVAVSLERVKGVNMNASSGAAEWVITQDKIKSKIQTLLEAYK